MDYGFSRRIAADPNLLHDAAIAKRFPTPSIDKLPDDIRDRLLAVQENRLHTQRIPDAGISPEAGRSLPIVR
jgi:hypothetical protein